MLAFGCWASSEQKFLVYGTISHLSFISRAEIVRFCLARQLEFLEISKIRFRWIFDSENFSLAIGCNLILGGLSHKLRIFGWMGFEKN